MKFGSKPGYHKGCFGSNTREERRASLAAVGRARTYTFRHMKRWTKTKEIDGKKVDERELRTEFDRTLKARTKVERKKIARTPRQRRVQARNG